MDAGKIIKQARKTAGLSQTELAERVGVTQSVVSDWENGRLHSYRDYAEGLARVLQRPQGQFATLSPEPIGAHGVEVVGEVQAGAFRRALEYPEDERYLLPIGGIEGYEDKLLYALKVVGPSMNRVYPDGSHVIVVRAIDAEVEENDRVVVHVRDGDLYEATLKQVRVEPDGRIGLYPESDHPDHQAPIFLSVEDQDGPEITHVVVVHWNQEKRPPKGRVISLKKA
jgi:transcriptional regulator with XRE-family HTH domain